MKTLKNHLILFDAECPMCNLYTSAFIQAGMLEPDGRLPYQQIIPNSGSQLDAQRAVDEIALINKDTGAVTYGVQSLFKILAHSIPALKYLFLFPPFE